MQTRSSSNVNMPNAVTMARIFLAPAVVVLLLQADGPSVAAAAVLAAAALTDVLDGHLARRRGSVTAAGALLDPFADKLLVGGAFVALSVIDRLPAWVVAAVIGREVFVTLLRALAFQRGRVLAAAPLGKAKMAVQVVTVFALVLAPDAGAAWVSALVAVMLLLTLGSGVRYAQDFRRAEPAPADGLPAAASPTARA